MRSITICLVVLGVLAFAVFSIPMSAQNQQYPFPGYPPEFSPLRTSRPRPPEPPKLQTKFNKITNSVANQYIVVLNDAAVPAANTPAELLANVTNIANDFVRIYGGKTRFIYETVLKGFSVELPNEAAAIAISQDPRVKYVESNAVGTTADCTPGVHVQSNPPQGLDRIDQVDSLLDHQYIYNACGSGVTVYVLDTGIRSSHVDFGGRAAIGIDYVNYAQPGGSPEPCQLLGGGPTSQNNDCAGHGTAVAAIVGGSTYGVAKGATIRSVKVCYATSATTDTNLSGSCQSDVATSAVNWVTQQHDANPSQPTLVNMSLTWNLTPNQPIPDELRLLNDAVRTSIAHGVTYALAAGNDSVDARYRVPADVPQALTIGAAGFDPNTANSDHMSSASDFGPLVDVFAPPVVLTARNKSDSDTLDPALGTGGTSFSAPHVAGTVGLYLEGRIGASASDCFGIESQVPNPNLPASSYAKISTCSDRVSQFIDSNAGLLKMNASTLGTGSPNRILWTGPLPTTTNPVDNQRFFVWQHYADFLTAQPEPDENGLNYWTSNITGCGVIGGCLQFNPPPTGCGTGFNYNNSCTGDKRVDVSRAFWVSVDPSWFDSSYGLTNFDPSASSPCGGSGPPSSATQNEKFLDEAYCVYLRRRPPHSDPGFVYWLGVLNSPQYGNRRIRMGSTVSSEHSSNRLSTTNDLGSHEVLGKLD